MENKDLIQYEKIITLNLEIFPMINECTDRLFCYIKDKCKKDNETLHFFQINYTNSERNSFGKDLKIKWAVTKNES
jgi:hypothetical protein